MITKFVGSNFKRLEAVSIEPEGSLVRISGKNAQGKSSVIEGIFAALGGSKALPKEALRRGADSGLLEVHLDDPAVIVRRKITASGSKLEIVGQDGSSIKSPQKMLDELLGKLAFDPLAFLAAKPAEQVKILLSVIDLKPDPERLDALAPDVPGDNPIARLDGQYQKTYDDRTVQGRIVKQIEGELAGLPETDADAPKETINIGLLVAERDKLVEAREERRRLNEERDRLVARNVELVKQILALEQERERNDDRMKEIEALPPVEVDFELDAIAEKIESAEAVNERYNQVLRRAEVEGRIERARTESEDLTFQLEAIKAYREELIVAAEMPVSGLGFGDGGVTFQDFPLSQASQAEGIRVSSAIGMALNPKLKLMFIKEGSLLDDDNLRVLESLAFEAGHQVWIEVVDSTGKIGIVIEDGNVAVVNRQVSA